MTLSTAIASIPYFRAATAGDFATRGPSVYTLHDYLLRDHQPAALAIHAALPADGGAVLCGRALFSRIDGAIVVRRAYVN